MFGAGPLAGRRGGFLLNRFKGVIFSKLFAFITLLLLQLALVGFLLLRFASLGFAAYVVFTIVTVLVLLALLERDELNPAYKLSWVLVIVLMPVAGAMLYLMWGQHQVPRKIRRRIAAVDERCDPLTVQDPDVLDALRREGRMLYRSARYLADRAHSPVYPSEGVRYYRIGEEFFPDFLEDIRAARSYVFIQYYIVKEGSMLEDLMEVLAQKAAEGLDVRFLYDGFGGMLELDPNFPRRCEALGIHCRVFMPLQFTVHVTQYAMLNHRDHRKIAVIDGSVGYTGGLNIADEYINRIERFGEWKDTAVRVEGEAVYNMCTTFLRAWDTVAGSLSDYAAYRPPPASREAMSLTRGYVQPYWDSPLDAENVSENAYLNVINHATRYVYISTPYLILDHEMITNLSLAAKSGVDVRILTPAIPDKPTVYLVTRSYYPVLLREGVRIYEYTPGFNHAKMYVSDDKIAIVGSANMDFRSLYLHFENCVAFYGGPVVGEVKQDMLDCFARSHEVTLEDTRKLPVPQRLMQLVAKFFAPLM